MRQKSFHVVMGFATILYSIWVVLSSFVILSAYQLEVRKFLVKLLSKIVIGASESNVASFFAFVSEKSLEAASVKFVATIIAERMGAQFSSFYDKIFFVDMLGLGSLFALAAVNVLAARKLESELPASLEPSIGNRDQQKNSSLAKCFSRLFINDLHGTTVKRYPYISYLPNWLLAKNNAERLVYKSHLLLNAYSPPKSASASSVIVWVCGAKKSESIIIPYLSSLGFFVVVPNYAQPPKFPLSDAVEFVSLCVDWIVENAIYYDADPERIFFLGEDTGASVALESLKHIRPNSVKGIFALCPRSIQNLVWTNQSTIPMMTLHAGDVNPVSDSNDRESSEKASLIKNFVVPGAVPYYYEFTSPRTISTVCQYSKFLISLIVY